ncbi:hypothetical protein QJS66_04960 [Kocuria rhizophila]|nr:hypothetical protein QJS66_04960 [Kocuria rhizophila]
MTTTVDSCGITAPQKITCSPAASFMPTTPPAVRPCGARRRREVQQLGVGRPSRARGVRHSAHAHHAVRVLGELIAGHWSRFSG